MLSLRADDRVLFLAIPPFQELTAIARILIAGCLVAVGTADEVDEGRQALREFENVMFIDATPDNIPWRDHFFTKIVVPHHLQRLALENGAEMYRLLAPGGSLVQDVENA
jgi:hypothetical protein